MNTMQFANIIIDNLQINLLNNRLYDTRIEQLTLLLTWVFAEGFDVGYFYNVSMALRCNGFAYHYEYC